MRPWPYQRGTVNELIFAEVVKPTLAGFKAGDDRVFRRVRVFSRMLARRRVATADVSALSTTTQMQPPTAVGKTFDAPRTGWRNIGFNRAGSIGILRQGALHTAPAFAVEFRQASAYSF
jgi:hypothetical protein